MYQKGKLVFTGHLEQHTAENGVAYFTAEALVVETSPEVRGLTATLRVSDLIQKLAHFVYDGVNTREAHKLFTWPANLGDNQAWAASKRAFIEQHVMHFPIRIYDVDENGLPTWGFISPEEFHQIPSGLSASDSFQHYLDHQSEFFFLRKELDLPK